MHPSRVTNFPVQPVKADRPAHLSITSDATIPAGCAR
jgi:hypothetical protein